MQCIVLYGLLSKFKFLVLEDAYHLMLFSLNSIVFKAPTIAALLAFVTMLILLFISALISGSEVAFFSLEPAQIEKLREDESNSRKALVLDLLHKPQRLLSAILISNNFVNIGIVLTSTYFVDTLFDFTATPWLLSFSINVGLVTFLLLLFGEIIPKVYATIAPITFATFMAYPMLVLLKITRPLGMFLIMSSNYINKRLDGHKSVISVDDLSHVIDIAQESTQDQREMLESIVRFGNIDVRSVMCSRVDVVAVDYSIDYSTLLDVIQEHGFSRMPVYDNTFDNVKGILYAKDLLTHLDNDASYNWQEHINEPYFVPESKKISDILKDFQIKKTHIAIVIDEYGGSSGIITLEDVVEEIMGDISDESDDQEVTFVQLDEFTYSFEAKTLVHDFCKIIGVEDSVFADVSADTLAGLVLELTEEIPKVGENFTIEGYRFTVQESDSRRIKRIKIQLLK